LFWAQPQKWNNPERLKYADHRKIQIPAALAINCCRSTFGMRPGRTTRIYLCCKDYIEGCGTENSPLIRYTRARPAFFWGQIMTLLIRLAKKTQPAAAAAHKFNSLNFRKFFTFF